MITRSKTYGSVTIEATFSWDNGDSSTGIAAGYGEDTCVEIKAGPLNVWLTWNDYDPQTHTHIEDPAHWIVDSIEIDVAGGHRVMDCYTSEASGRILRLSELPEVLSVVLDAYRAWMALERLQAASETMQYADELRYMADNPDMAREMGYTIPEPDRIEAETRSAEAELDAARFEALLTGATNQM